MADYINPRAQACQNCVKAKAKCYGHHNGKCERCNRLNRDCVMQAPIVRRQKPGRKARQAQAGRIAELEEKINCLVSLLGNQPPPITGSIPSSVVTPESMGTPSNASFSLQDQLLASSTSEDTRTDSVDPIPSIQAQAVSMVTANETSLSFDRPSEEILPDELLDIFRENLARSTPFVLVPSEVNAQTLSAEKPFLYRAILTVASYHDSVHQIALGQQFIKDVTEYLILQGQKSLDLLQGLLVYISWYNALFHGRSQVNTLLGLAFSLVVDLHLYLPMADVEDHEKFQLEMKGILTCHHCSMSWVRRTEPTKEERRTVLGCFYLFSCASSNFSRVNPLQWTAYMQQCHDEILNSPENKDDIYLAYLSELQRISEDIRLSGIRGFQSQPRTWNSATRVHFKLLMSALERFKASLPEALREDSMMLLHYHTVELYLYEVCFSMPPSKLAQIPELQRADVLLKCATATESFLDIYFSANSKPHLIFFLTFMGQIYFVMTTMSKLSLFTAEDWNGNNLPASLNLSIMVDRLAIRLESISTQYDRMRDNKPWLIVSRKIRQMGVRFERLQATKNPPLDSLPLVTQGMFDLNQFPLLDDNFWQTLTDDTTFN